MDSKPSEVDYTMLVGKGLSRALAVGGLIYIFGTESMKEKVIKDSLIFGAGGGLISEMFLEDTITGVFSTKMKPETPMSKRY